MGTSPGNIGDDLSGKDVVLRQAITSYEANRLDNARELLLGLLQNEPQDADAQYVLGRVELRGGNPAAAAWWFEQVLRKSPHHKESALYLIQANRQLGNEHPLPAAAMSPRGDTELTAEKVRLQQEHPQEAVVTPIAAQSGVRRVTSRDQVPVQGIARNVKDRSQFMVGPLWLQTFQFEGAVTSGRETSITVEIRGSVLAGRVNENDRIRLVDFTIQDGVVVATKVWNESVGGSVESSRGLRAARLTRQATLGPVLGNVAFGAPIIALGAIAILVVLFLGFGVYKMVQNPPAGFGPSAGVSLNPSEGTAGTVVIVSGHNFQSGEKVEIYLQGQLVSSGAADDNRSFVVQVVIPNSYSSFHGQHISIEATGDSSGRTATTTFLIQ